MNNQSMSYLFAVGSYTHPESPAADPQGRGISIYEWDNSANSARLVSESQDIRNPSYLSWDSGSQNLYAVSEMDENAGTVAVFHLDADGTLKLQNQQEGPGRAGCHLTILHNPPRLFAASYIDGSLRAYSLDNGQIIPAFWNCTYTGNGPVTERQASSHAHQVLPGPFGNFLYVSDLGSDIIWMHSPDALDEPPSAALKVPPGYGPRHLAFDPEGRHAYVLCELQPILLVCSINPRTGEMKVLQELQTAAPGNMNIAAPAAVELHPSGQTLAVSNRFDDTVAVFTISRGAVADAAGKSPVLSLAERFPCRGKTPRDITFSPDGSRLFIANQDSHNISCRNFNTLTGLPGEGWGEGISTGSPVCVVML